MQTEPEIVTASGIPVRSNLPMPDEPKEQTISSDALEKLTGLSDRRHRQIAKLGFFPPPKNGVYLLSPTIRGMFVYYRGLNQNETRELKLREEHRKLKLINDFKEGKLIPIETVKHVHSRTLARVDQVIEQKLSNEYPSAVAGLDVPQARVYGKRLGDQLREEFQKLNQLWQ